MIGGRCADSDDGCDGPGDGSGDGSGDARDGGQGVRHVTGRDAPFPAAVRPWDDGVGAGATLLSARQTRSAGYAAPVRNYAKFPAIVIVAGSHKRTSHVYSFM